MMVNTLRVFFFQCHCSIQWSLFIHNLSISFFITYLFMLTSIVMDVLIISETYFIAYLLQIRLQQNVIKCTAKKFV